MGCTLTDFKSVVSCFGNQIVTPLIAFLVGIALLVIIMGVVKYIAKGDQPEERKKGAAYMAYGIVGIFVMLSVWGLVKILTNTFFPGTDQLIQPPVPAITI
jgi:uncharacterized membrane protein